MFFIAIVVPVKLWSFSTGSEITNASRTIDGNSFARIGPRTDKIIQQSFVLLERIRAELLQN